MDEWINKTWYIHTIEYYSTLKREGILTQAPIWIYLEGITLIMLDAKGIIPCDSTSSRFVSSQENVKQWQGSGSWGVTA